MRVALISDIHANFEALRTLTDVLESADTILCAGDIVGYYCEVNQVIDYLRQLDARCVLGNHDYFLLHGCPSDLPPSVRFGVEFAARVISADNRSWLASLPLTWGGYLDGRTFLVVHGSPWQPVAAYLYPDSPALPRLYEFDYDVILFGHTHRAICRLERKPFLINPGSIGQSRDVKACACAMVIDTESMVVERIERSYDVNPVVTLATLNGASDWVTKHLA